jgi:hypothetical protein
MSRELLQEMSAGISDVDRRAESDALIKKWQKTGLLENLDERRSSNLARLFENQARQLLKEASTSGDIVGFQNVAFPIVRRVFAGLIANELVSVQPMSLPSGLLFYMDYRYDNPAKAGNRDDGFATGGSLFGDQTAPGTENLGTGGMYNLATSFSQREKVSTGTLSYALASATHADVLYDPDLATVGASGTQALGVGYVKVTVSSLFNTYPTLTNGADFAGALVGANDLKQWVPLSGSSTSWSTGTDGTPVRMLDWQVYRRHTVRSTNDLVFVVKSTTSANHGGTATGTLKLSFIAGATITGGTSPSGTQYTPDFESDLGTSPVPVIPEIDFTIKSVAVTANSRKLRAKWTPELAQDLAAYQNLDAEVELTQVLAEAISIEIDREILGDLLANATGANFYWSRRPGRFLIKNTGVDTTGSFTGTVREWYETLIETIIDVANNIHRKTLRGAANFLVTSPDVATILEASVLYKPTLSMDPKETMFTVGTEKVGSLNNRFTVYKDPYFPRNKILVGYKGNGFLETGYVYAPYVPLIVTPTIYGPEDFTPRKGVMTRYAKKLVRSDFYGTVTCLDLNVI